MAINTSTFESTLQTKLDAVSDAKEMLLLGKALESTVGSIAVSDITTEGNTKVAAVNTAGTTQVSAVNSAGTTQVAAVNSIATGTFKTVGGSSILGSGDIATLPSGGSAGQVLKKDGSNNASWGADEGGKLIGFGYSDNGTQYVVNQGALYLDYDNPSVSHGHNVVTLTYTPQSSNSRLLVTAQTFTSEFNRNEEGGTRHALFLDSTKLAIALHGKAYYSAYSEDGETANKLLAGSWTSHTAGTPITLKLNIGCKDNNGRYFTVNSVNALTALQGSVGDPTTSWIKVMEVAL